MIRTIRSVMEIGLAASTAVMLIACSFRSPDGLDTPEDLYRIVNTAPYAEPYDSGRWTAFEDPGRFRADHGYSCIYASRAASKTYLGIRVMEQAPIPENHDATVFLNGWSADYSSSDHHVTGLGSMVFNVQKVDGQLLWDAGGVLSDKKGDDAFEWCYDYTILYWPSGSNQFDVRATHSDPTGRLLFVQAEVQDGAVHTIPGSFTATSNKLPRAALPSGFAMAWNHSDHHLAQLGFELGDQSLSGKTLAWTSSAIFKDNAKSRGYQAAEAVTILSGRGIKVTKPEQVLVLENDAYVPISNAIDFTPLPKTSCPNVQLGGPLSKIRNYAITGLTSHYAVPMLTGFELAFDCDDQHVKYVGAKIRDFAYQPPSDGGTGTLYYQVETLLTDKDKIPEMNDRVEVSVLGINRLGS